MAADRYVFISARKPGGPFLLLFICELARRALDRYLLSAFFLQRGFVRLNKKQRHNNKKPAPYNWLLKSQTKYRARKSARSQNFDFSSDVSAGN